MDTAQGRRQKTTGNLFTLVSLIGALFVASEIILQTFGKRICETEGCKLVAQYVRFGDISILLIGVSVFSLLAILSILRTRSNSPFPDRCINLILITALACEGFFTGYQAFRLFTPCLFCLIVFSFLIILGIIRIASGEKEVMAGFASFVGVFALFYLILPAGGASRLPQEPLTLFYSKNCKSCEAIMAELEKNNIKLPHVLSSEYPGFLRSVGIEYVPTLFVNNKFEKFFISGEPRIKEYLLGHKNPESGKEKASAAKRKTAKKNIKVKPDEGEKKTNAVSPVVDLLSPQKESPLSLPASDSDGVCKENENCD